MQESSGARLTIRRGHVKPVWAGHPWVYAQAVARLEGSPAAGDVVAAYDAEDHFLGRGFWSPGSAIPLRLVTRDADEALDGTALSRRVAAAVARRADLLGLPDATTDGFRLVHAEGDSLPGLVVDHCGEVVTVQVLTVGMARHREAVFDALATLPGVRSVVEVPGGEGQRREGIALAAAHTVRGPQVSELACRERGLRWRLPLGVAQKTGLYFDQRDHRARVEELAPGRRVLDLYCYLGGFALAAARGGAREVLGVDRSVPALAAAALAAADNGLDERLRFATADLRRPLTVELAGDEPWDLVVLDPPKLAPTARDLPRARTAYEAINTAALGLLAPGGLLLTCSCSAAMAGEELLRTVATAARRSGRQARVLEVSGQAADHPTPPAFPEGRYLTCVLLAVD